MAGDDRYFFLYLAIVFGGLWGLALFLLIFDDFSARLFGEITLLHPVIVFFTYLPSLSGLAIYYFMGGMAAVTTVLSKFIPRKKDVIWFPVLFVIFIFFVLVMRFGSLVCNLTVPRVSFSFSQMITEVLLNFISETGIIGGVIGWTAFLLPYLQGRFKNNVLSGLLTGLLFGLWLLPGFAFSPAAGSISCVLYIVQLMAFFIFQSYIFNATKGCPTFYLFSFGLISSGSHIQLYYFTVPIQMMQIAFFIMTSLLLSFVFKKYHVDHRLQTLQTFVPIQMEANETRHQNLTNIAR